jgi:hypothetical protein
MIHRGSSDGSYLPAACLSLFFQIAYLLSLEATLVVLVICAVFSSTNLASFVCSTFPNLQYEPEVVASDRAEEVMVMAPLSLSSRWLFLLLYNLFSGLGYWRPPWQVSVDSLC